MRITPAAAAVLLGVLTILGLLAYMQVPGAAVAAVGAVGTIMAWLTQPPTKDGSKVISIAPDAHGDASELPTLPPPPPTPKDLS